MIDLMRQLRKVLNAPKLNVPKLQNQKALRMLKKITKNTVCLAVRNPKNRAA